MIGLATEDALAVLSPDERLATLAIAAGQPQTGRTPESRCNLLRGFALLLASGMAAGHAGCPGRVAFPPIRA